MKVAAQKCNMYLMQALTSSPHTCTPTRCTFSSSFYTPFKLPLSSQSSSSNSTNMADRDRPQPHQFQIHPQPHPRHEGGVKDLLPSKGPSAVQILAIITLLPVGGSLLGLAGITLVGTLIGLAVATPLFVICSPVLVPAAILLAGAVTGFLTSGAFGLTGLSSFSWVFNSFRKATGQEPLEYARRRVQEGIIQVGEKTKQVGEMVGEKTKQTGDTIKTKAQEGGGAGART